MTNFNYLSQNPQFFHQFRELFFIFPLTLPYLNSNWGWRVYRHSLEVAEGIWFHRVAGPWTEQDKDSPVFYLITIPNSIHWGFPLNFHLFFFLEFLNLLFYLLLTNYRWLLLYPPPITFGFIPISRGMSFVFIYFRRSNTDIVVQLNTWKKTDCPRVCRLRLVHHHRDTLQQLPDVLRPYVDPVSWWSTGMGVRDDCYTVLVLCTSTSCHLGVSPRKGGQCRIVTRVMISSLWVFQVNIIWLLTCDPLLNHKGETPKLS